MKKQLLFFSVLFFMIGATGFAQTTLPGLVGHWKFDERSGTTVADELGTTNGELVNSVAGTWADGYMGSALDFSQTDGNPAYARFSGDGATSLAGNFSFMCWVKSPMSPDGDTEYSIISKGVPFLETGGVDGGWYHLSLKDNAIRFMIWDETTLSSPAGAVDSWNPDEWYHVACVRDYDGIRMHTYLNGELLSSEDDGLNATIANNEDLTFGSVATGVQTETSPDQGSPFWPSNYLGMLDEVQMYNVALSANDVKTIYESYVGGGSGAPEPVSNWSLDEGSGTTVTDDKTGATGTIEVTEGDLPTWVDGIQGSAVNFNAGDTSGVIIIEDNETNLLGVINFTDQGFSVSAWVKMDPTGLEGVDQWIVVKGDNGNDSPLGNGNGNRFLLQTKDGELRFAIDDDVTKTQLGVHMDAIPGGYPVNEWAHLVGVRDWDNITVKLYLNGEEIGSMDDGTAALDLAGQRMLIGGYHLRTNQFFGSIDEVAIFNQALTAEEVMALYTSYGATGIFNSKESVETLSVYPNPVSSSLNLQNMSELTNVEIYSIAGTLVKSVKNSRNNLLKVNVNDLPMGKYIIKGYGEDKVAVGSFIKL